MKEIARTKPFRHIRRLGKIPVVLAIIWLAGDFGYSRYVAWSIAGFESVVSRDKNGIIEGCQEYTLGGGDEAILLIHGINDSPAVWYRMAPVMAETGRTIRGMRLPGFALPAEQYASKSVDDWLAGVDGEIRRLREVHSKVHVVCHSLGAAIFLRWLQDNPDGVDSVTLLSPAIEVSSSRSPLLPVRWWHNISSGLVFTRVVWSPFDNDVLDPEARLHSLRTPFSPRRVISQTFTLVDANRNRAPAIRVPTLMVLSREDRVNRWEAAEEFFGQIGTARKQLVFNDRSGHVLPVDYGWDTVTGEILEFIGQESAD